MDKKTLIDNLYHDLADELSAIVQYLTYAAKVTGPYRPQLVQFFTAEIPDEQMHAQFLANKIVALGVLVATNVRSPSAVSRWTNCRASRPFLVEPALHVTNG